MAAKAMKGNFVEKQPWRKFDFFSPFPSKYKTKLAKLNDKQKGKMGWGILGTFWYLLISISFIKCNEQLIYGGQTVVSL